ncbi:MAG: Nramp family divalent metal transporter [Candidatus Nanopelagicales bacterium]
MHRTGTTSPHARTRPPRNRLISLLGPAFVAAVAYVDPGNVAANLTAGARYGYLLLWVLVGACAMAVMVQYQSAKLGIVTGRSLPELLGDRLARGPRLAYWAQAELVAAATDIAEVVGGAIALQLLFGLPLVLGGLLVGAVSLLLLATQDRYGPRRFESVMIGLLLIITLGFLAGLVVAPPDPAGMAAGMLPRFAGTDSVLLAASMLGATVMPHAVYAHSALARDRFGPPGSPARVARLLRATKWDVAAALALAGTVNIGLLLLAASALPRSAELDSIAAAHQVIGTALGGWVATAFAVGLLASGLASTSVGAYAGATIMEGMLGRGIPLIWRRAVTLLPAIVLLGLTGDPTWSLVLSQVVLSFGIPFAVLPLLVFGRDRALLGESVNRPITQAVLAVVATAVVVLNLALLALLALGE